MKSGATASVAYLATAEERLCPVFGSASLSTLETTIVKATRLDPHLPLRYELEVEIEGVGLPSYQTKIRILESITSCSAGFFPVQFANLGVQTEKDLAGKPVTAFYDGTRLVGLQRRY